MCTKHQISSLTSLTEKISKQNAPDLMNNNSNNNNNVSNLIKGDLDYGDSDEILRRGFIQDKFIDKFDRVLTFYWIKFTT